MPPGYFLGSLVAIGVLRLLAPTAVLSGPGLLWGGGLLVGLGLVLNVLGVSRFERTGTPVRPGSRSTRLSTSGVFAISRNPMYLGLVLALGGFGLGLGTLPGMLVPAAFVGLINRQFIRHEEALLLQQFGDDYLRYQARVGRWLRPLRPRSSRAATGPIGR